MASVPWEQSVHFLAASHGDVLSGGATSYVYPRRIGNSPRDVTSFHPGQAPWSKQNLPDIFYVLNPTKEWKKHAFSKRPDRKRDQAGIVIWEVEPDEGQPPRALLDFKVLPDKIGTNEEYVFFELWRRLDGRIRWSDILMRMERTNRPKGNAISMIALRVWRPALGLIAWHIKGTKDGRDAQQVKVLNRLTTMQKADNTTRGLSPGLIDLALGEAGGRIAWPTLKIGCGDLKRQDKVEVDSEVEDDDYAPDLEEFGCKEKGDAVSMLTKSNESFQQYYLKQSKNHASEPSKHLAKEDGFTSKYILGKSHREMRDIVEGPLLCRHNNNKDDFMQEEALDEEENLEEEAAIEYELIHKPVRHQLGKETIQPNIRQADYRVFPNDRTSFRDNRQALRSQKVNHGGCQDPHNGQGGSQYDHRIFGGGHRAYQDDRAFRDDQDLQDDQVFLDGHQALQNHGGFKATMRWNRVPTIKPAAEFAVSETMNQDATEPHGWFTGARMNDAENTMPENIDTVKPNDLPVLPSGSFSIDQDWPQMQESRASNEIKHSNLNRKFAEDILTAGHLASKSFGQLFHRETVGGTLAAAAAEFQEFQACGRGRRRRPSY